MIRGWSIRGWAIFCAGILSGTTGLVLLFSGRVHLALLFLMGGFVICLWTADQAES